MTNRSHRRRGFTLIETAVVFAVAGMLAALLAPAIQQAREAARSTQCKNNLKQFGLALHNYHDTHSTFAPGWVAHHRQPQSGPHFGWTVMILPFMDQFPLFSGLNFRQPPPAPNALMTRQLPTYRCPSDPTPKVNLLRSGYGTCNYSGNFGDQPLPRLLPDRFAAAWPGILPTPQKSNGVFHWNSKVRLRDISDGSSNTLLTGERSVTSGAGIWMGVSSNEFENDQVTDTSHSSQINAAYSSFSSRHAGGAHFGFCDGRVQFIKQTVNSSAGSVPGVFQKLGNRRDGLEINANDF